MKGGADTTLYELHQCNWERDFLTTAVPNPQQGANAPLVGLTVGDVVTRSEDGTYSVQKQTVLVDEDGSKYGVSYKVSEDGERLVGVDYDLLYICSYNDVFVGYYLYLLIHILGIYTLVTL